MSDKPDPIPDDHGGFTYQPPPAPPQLSPYERSVLSSWNVPVPEPEKPVDEVHEVSEAELLKELEEEEAELLKRQAESDDIEIVIAGAAIEVVEEDFVEDPVPSTYRNCNCPTCRARRGETYESGSFYPKPVQTESPAPSYAATTPTDGGYGKDVYGYNTYNSGNYWQDTNRRSEGGCLMFVLGIPVLIFLICALVRNISMR
jgi:hypothetical protein